MPYQLHHLLRDSAVRTPGATSLLFKDQVFDYKIPFLHDNIQYGRQTISNTEVLTSSKYINMTMSTFYFLDRKINMYRETLETSRELIIDIDKKLKD